MYWAGAICLFVAVAGVALGGPSTILAGLVWGGVGIFLIYWKATSKQRWANINAKKREEELKKQEELKRQTISESKIRFGKSTFGARLIQELNSRNWSDLDYTKSGCQVFHDKIVTPNKTYLFDDFNLKNLDNRGCEMLAYFIGESYGHTQYDVIPITRAFGGYTNSFSGYVGTDGGVHVSQDYSGGVSTIGYRVYTKKSKPNPKLKQNW